jgi:hypothetical protein
LELTLLRSPMVVAIKWLFWRGTPYHRDVGHRDTVALGLRDTGTGGTTEADFPFGWSQLNSDGGATMWTVVGGPSLPPFPPSLWIGLFEALARSQCFDKKAVGNRGVCVVGAGVEGGQIAPPSPADDSLFAEQINTCWRCNFSCSFE